MHAKILRSASCALNLNYIISFSKLLTFGSKYPEIVGNKSVRLLQTSIPMGNHKNVNFSELKELLDDKKTVVIDVREKEELDESGRIEGTYHVPLGEVTQALQLDPSEFEAKYGFPKPQASTKIVFSCRSGKRSLSACDLAEKQGFKNLLNYSGGFLDWSERTKKK